MEHSQETQIMKFSDLLILFTIFVLQKAEAVDAQAGCPVSCGNISVPYPFGIASGCFLQGFNLTCSNETNPPKLFIDTNHRFIEVTSISLDEGLVYANNRIALPDFVNLPTVSVTGPFNLPADGPFAVSEEHNAFTSVGCGNLASFVDPRSNESYSMCAAICRSRAGLVAGSCSGIGCCQAEIPPGITNYGVQLRILNQTQFIANVLSMKAFLVRKDWFTFSPSYLSAAYLNQSSMVPIVIRWALGKSSCEEAAKNTSTFACRSSNSRCFNANSTAGYICRCSRGYQGNPYILGGCKDVCITEPESSLCSSSTSSSFSSRKLSVLAALLMGFGIGIGLLLASVSGLLLYRRWQQTNIRKLKTKHFHKNRGLLMQQLLSSNDDSTARRKMFSLEELDKATNNFDSSRILGGGGHGTVYKGILSDQRVVAIKKSNVMVQTESDQFINEVVILSQINHRNVVKLYGCCLETEVPLLVYEFVSNGPLSDHLHNKNTESSLSWDDRLRIATETAGALAYLHSAAHISIFHRDVKSSNILLNDSFTAKVSDFGSSRLLMLNQTSVTTAVQGTFGYLDPEYYHTGQLTEKSDVYSFGVILAELLTGEKPISFTRSEEQRNLSAYFLSALQEGRLFQLVEPGILKEANREEIEEFARLAEQCLSLSGLKRPTMKEVEVKLLEIRRLTVKEHPWAAENKEEISMSLLPEKYQVASSHNSSRQFSLEKELHLSANYPR